MEIDEETKYNLAILVMGIIGFIMGWIGRHYLDIGVEILKRTYG